MNSSGSSWNQEIFQNALANLEELSHDSSQHKDCAPTDEEFSNTNSPPKWLNSLTQKSDTSANFHMPSYFESHPCGVDTNTTQEDFSFSSSLNQSVAQRRASFAAAPGLNSKKTAAPFTNFCASLESSIEQVPPLPIFTSVGGVCIGGSNYVR